MSSTKYGVIVWKSDQAYDDFATFALIDSLIDDTKATVTFEDKTKNDLFRSYRSSPVPTCVHHARNYQFTTSDDAEIATAGFIDLAGPRSIYVVRYTVNYN